MLPKHERYHDHSVWLYGNVYIASFRMIGTIDVVREIPPWRKFLPIISLDFGTRQTGFVPHGRQSWLEIGRLADPTQKRNIICRFNGG